MTQFILQSRLIRNVADFSNVFFVCAFDTPYVISAIEGISNYNKEFFLEKIFQFEFSLPEFPNEYVTNTLHKQLKYNLSEYGKEQFEKMQSDYTDSLLIKHVESFVRSIRDSTRFINQYVYWGRTIENEVYFPHLYAILFFRLKFPAILRILQLRHDEIFKGSSVYIEQNQNDTIELSSEPSKKNGFIEKNEYQIFKILTKENLYKPSDIDLIIDTLILLFPSRNFTYPIQSANFNLQHKINKSRSFYRYFLDINTLGSLSTVEFDNARNLGKKELIIKIEDWTKNKQISNEIFEKFSTIKSFDNTEDFESIIESFIYFSDIKSKTHTSDRIYIEYMVDVLGLYDTKKFNKVKEAYSKNNNTYIDYLNTLFKESNLVNSFINDVVFYLIESNTTENISRKDLIDILVKKLEIALQNFHLNYDTFTLFRRIYTIEPIFENDREYIQNNKNKLIKLIKDYVLNNSMIWFVNFCAMWQNFGDGLLFGINGWCKVIFESEEDFIKIIESYESSETYEFISFYNELLKHSKLVNKPIEQCFIKYDFKHIKPLGIRTTD